MDIRKVKKLIELLEESGIEELEICEGEESVRISRGSRHPAAPAHYYASPQAAAPRPRLPPLKHRHRLTTPLAATWCARPWSALSTAPRRRGPPPLLR